MSLCADTKSNSNSNKRSEARLGHSLSSLFCWFSFGICIILMTKHERHTEKQPRKKKNKISSDPNIRICSCAREWQGEVVAYAADWYNLGLVLPPRCECLQNTRFQWQKQHFLRFFFCLPSFVAYLHGTVFIKILSVIPGVDTLARRTRPQFPRLTALETSLTFKWLQLLNIHKRKRFLALSDFLFPSWPKKVFF